MKTRIKNRLLLTALTAGLGLILAGRVNAQAFTTLHNFTEGIDGVSLQAGLVSSGNVLYGTTEYGGASGGSTLFAVNTNGSGFRIVYNFSAEAPNNLGFNTNSDAGGSDGTLVLSGNTLYGASYDGGTNGTGAVFAINTNGTFTLLHDFSAGKTNPATGLFTNSDGYGAEAGMILSGSTLYGTTENGGTKGYGVVFKVNTNGTGFVNLYNFTNGTDGSIPHTLVISGGTLYGTSLGYSGNGTVFALGTNGTGFTTLHSFIATNFTFPQGGPAPGPLYTNSDGVGPGGLILTGITLFGTAGWGGTNGNGTVFALNTNGMGFTILHNFAASRTNSSGVYTNSEGAQTIAFSGLVLSSNILYGTAYYGGSAGNGTVFAVNTNGTGFTNLYNFTATQSDSFGNNTNSDGANPYAGLTLSSTTLYGTAKDGGTNGAGTVFSLIYSSTIVPLAVTTTSLPNDTNGVTYNQTLAASGGKTPYTWTNISGALPPALTLAASGQISGTPTTNGTFDFTVQVTDALSETATQALALTVIGPTIQFTASPTNGVPPLTVQFNSPMVDSLGNAITSWDWNFDDGSTSTLQNPSHTYTNNGSFTPTLLVTNHNGVAVIGSGPQIVTTSGLPGVTIQPTNNSILVAAGSGLQLAVSVTGVGPFSYHWQLNGANLTGGIIKTIAGGYLGDGSPATNASLNFPGGTAVDASGNLFIPDSHNNLIRKVDTNGIITTVAGNGIVGYSGDGGAATNAELSYPSEVAVDAAGNLFIADTANSVIRKVGTNGIISTVAGNGNYSYYGDEGAATNASLIYPSGVAADATGNLFIADKYNGRIRKVGTNGIITTVAGNGTYGYRGDGGAATNAELAYPNGVAVDAIGNLFIADSSNQRIRKVGTNGIITTVAGNGTYGLSGDEGAATNASLIYPSGVAVDASGNVFIADTYLTNIREVGTNGIITTVAGNVVMGYSGDGGPATSASLAYSPQNSVPPMVAVDTSGNLYIADSGNGRIREVGTNGVITTVAGGYLGDGSPAANASLNFPGGTAVDASGNLFVADCGNQRVRMVDSNGIITTVAGNGITDYSGDGGPATNASLAYSPPSVGSVAVDTSGNLFIADSGNSVIREVFTNGIIATVAGGGGNYPGDGGPATNASLASPSGVAVDTQGDFFIADSSNERVCEVGINGIITTVAGNGTYGYSGDGGAATNAAFNNPSGVAVDAAGNLFIADQYNECVRKVGIDGIITTVAGNGSQGYSGDGGAATNAELNLPAGVAVDTAGNLFIADSQNNVIREVGTNGIITTLAGNGYVNFSTGFGGYSGDGGAATKAELWSPSGVTVDTAGDLFIADFQNNRIREVVGGQTLVLNDVGSGNAGAYDVVVSSPYGSVTSSVVNVAIMPLSVSYVQPTNNSVTATAGTNVSLAVAVAGFFGPITYEWQLDGTNLPNGIITTVAGNGTNGYSGDGGAATNAELYNPSGVAVDALGNLFIADNANYVIRKVDLNGKITTVAGNGYSGYSGDGGPATNADLNLNSYGMAVDTIGNLFIADLDDGVIREVDTNEIITTVAGNGTSGYSGDGGAATNAELNLPAGVAVDATGNLFIADQYNNVIREVDTNGIITTVAGNGTSGYSGDGGVATNAELNFPTGVAIDSTGNLFIADYINYVVREVKTNGIITTFAGNGTFGYSGDGGPATNAEMSPLTGVAVDDAGNLFIADQDNEVIREVDADGIITTVAGNGNQGYSGDGGAATNAELNLPADVAVDGTGNLFIADLGNNRIRKTIILGPELVLNNLADGNAGMYDVVVSGQYGSVTSSVVNLTITLPFKPVILSGSKLSINKADFTFMLSGPAGSNYVLQVSTNLMNWSSVSTSTIPASGTITLSNAINGYNRQFYRVYLQ